MTIREAISSVKVGIKEVNADTILSNKFIYSRLISCSNLLIQRESDALRLANDNIFYQTLRCEKMEEVPSIESCYGVRNKTTVFRTVNELSDIYTDQTGVMIGLISTIDTSKKIVVTTPESIIRAKMDTNSKYDKTVYAFYKENRIYITERYRAIDISAAFINDISRRSKCNCLGEDTTCYRFLDTQWIIPKKLEKAVINEVTKELVQSFSQLTTQNVMDKNPNT